MKRDQFSFIFNLIQRALKGKTRWYSNLSDVGECSVDGSLNSVPSLVASFLAVVAFDDGHVEGVRGREGRGQEVDDADQQNASFDLQNENKLKVTNVRISFFSILSVLGTLSVFSYQHRQTDEYD